MAFSLAVRQKASRCCFFLGLLPQPLLTSVFRTKWKKATGCTSWFLLKHNQIQITYSRCKLVRLNSMSGFSRICIFSPGWDLLVCAGWCAVSAAWGFRNGPGAEEKLT